MIKRCFLYKATQRGSVARSSEKRCREERGPEREPERRSESLMRTGDRNRSCEREVGIAEANEEIGIAGRTGRSESLLRTGTGSGIGSKIVKRETGNEETRKRGNEETRKRGNEETRKDQKQRETLHGREIRLLT